MTRGRGGEDLLPVQYVSPSSRCTNAHLLGFRHAWLCQAAPTEVHDGRALGGGTLTSTQVPYYPSARNAPVGTARGSGRPHHQNSRPAPLRSPGLPPVCPGRHGGQVRPCRCRCRCRRSPRSWTHTRRAAPLVQRKDVPREQVAYIEHSSLTGPGDPHERRVASKAEGKLYGRLKICIAC